MLRLTILMSFRRSDGRIVFQKFFASIDTNCGLRSSGGPYSSLCKSCTLCQTLPTRSANAANLELVSFPLAMWLSDLCVMWNHQGAAVLESQRDAFARLIRKSRRFFPHGSAGEIWAEFGPGLQSHVQDVPFESLGWLCLLMPTHAVATADGVWDQWVDSWIDMWGSMVHCSYWDSLWMGLLARLIKHDSSGSVPWSRHLEPLFSRFLWVFQVPVGASSSSIPISRCEHKVP